MTKPKKRRGRGRSTKLTAERRRIILEAINPGGNFLETAAGLAGIGVATLHEWIARGEARDPDRPHSKLYAEFAAAVREALAKAEARNVAIVQAAAFGRKADPANGTPAIPPDPKMALAWLDRRHSSRWAPKQAVDVTSAGAPLASSTAKADALPYTLEELEELDKISAAAAARAAAAKKKEGA